MFPTVNLLHCILQINILRYILQRIVPFTVVHYLFHCNLLHTQGLTLFIRQKPLHGLVVSTNPPGSLCPTGQPASTGRPVQRVTSAGPVQEQNLSCRTPLKYSWRSSHCIIRSRSRDTSAFLSLPGQAWRAAAATAVIIVVVHDSDCVSAFADANHSELLFFRWCVTKALRCLCCCCCSRQHSRASRADPWAELTNHAAFQAAHYALLIVPFPISLIVCCA